MKKVNTFKEVLEAADKLTIEEQEAIVDILCKRMSAKRRKELIAEVRKAQTEYKQGTCQECTPDEIIKEILS